MSIKTNTIYFSTTAAMTAWEAAYTSGSYAYITDTNRLLAFNLETEKHYVFNTSTEVFDEEGIYADIDANTAHAALTNNPHTVTAAQVGNTTAQWNADQLLGVDLDATGLADGYTWVYSTSSGNWEVAAIGAAGEANTASNVGTAGVGVYKQKSGVNIELKKINAGSSKVTVTDDTGDDEIDIDIVPANINAADINDDGTYAASTHTHVEADITDLQAYLTVEVNDLSAAVTWANVPNANITQSSVTQHQAALSITESQISDLQAYLTTETDPVFTAWDKSTGITITESQITDLDHDALKIQGYDVDVTGLADDYILYYDQTSGDWKVKATPVGGSADHGALTGLADDDHTQYHTDGRADTWLATKDTDDLAEGVTNLYNQTHTGDVTGAVALTIAADAVTYSKIQNVVGNNVILGNNSGAGFPVEELTATDVRTIINVEDGSQANSANSLNISGQDVYTGDTGSTHNFRGVKSDTAKITVTSDTEHVIIGLVETSIDHNNLDNYDSTQHTPLNDTITTSANLWSANKVNTEITGLFPSKDSDDLVEGSTNLYFTSSERTKLSGIEALAEVNNISDANATDLTDGGASSLHYHTSDRARANHTGTQAISTVTGLQTALDEKEDLIKTISIDAGKTIAASENGTTFYLRSAATGNETYTLPTASAGLQYTFFNANATYQIIVTANTGDVIVGADGTTSSGGTYTTKAAGDTLTVRAMDSDTWAVVAAHTSTGFTVA